MSPQGFHLTERGVAFRAHPLEAYVQDKPLAQSNANRFAVHAMNVNDVERSRSMGQVSAADLLRDLNQLDEHPKIEAKTGSELGKSALQTVCALANEPRLGGGYLLFGVRAASDPRESRYEAVGIPDADKLQGDLASQCASVFNRPIRPELWTELVHGKLLVGAYVPESPAGHKPVYFANQGLARGAFRRIGSADQRCTEDDLLVFYSDRHQQTFDATPMPDVALSEIDPDAIAEYRRERSRINPSAEELHWTDDELLLAIERLCHTTDA